MIVSFVFFQYYLDNDTSNDTALRQQVTCA